MLGPGGTAQLPNPAPGRLCRDPLLVGFRVEHLQYLDHHHDPALQEQEETLPTPADRDRLLVGRNFRDCY